MLPLSCTRSANQSSAPKACLAFADGRFGRGGSPRASCVRPRTGRGRPSVEVAAAEREEPRESGVVTRFRLAAPGREQRCLPLQRTLCGRDAGEAGEPLAPGPLPIADVGALGSNLGELAVSSAREGCVGETVGAVEARAALGRATDDEVRRVLEVVERDESNHAELAWQTVRWAIDRGGRSVEDAVAAAFRHELEVPLVPGDPRSADPELLAAYGVLSPGQRSTRAFLMYGWMLHCQSCS